MIGQAGQPPEVTPAEAAAAAGAGRGQGVREVREEKVKALIFKLKPY